MSRELKQMIKEAKHAVNQKQFKVAIEKCNEILNEDPRNYHAFLLLGAIHQDNEPAQAVKYLKYAVECNPKDPKFAYQGLLRCAPVDDIPDVAMNLLKYDPSKYSDVHRKLETCALVNKIANACISILQNEVSSVGDQERVQSAYSSLVQIYLNNPNIEAQWLNLFREAFEVFIADRAVPNHCRMFTECLKILNKSKCYDVLIRRSIEMLRIYPKEYVPLDMLCSVYLQTYDKSDFNFMDYVPEGIGNYANELLSINETSANAHLAKGLHCLETENYVNAREFLSKANGNTKFNELCLRTLAYTHFHLHAFSLAEYCFTKSQALNANIKQNANKWKKLLSKVDSIMLTATDKTQQTLCELLKKALKRTNDDEQDTVATEESNKRLLSFKYRNENNFEKALDALQNYDGSSCEYLLELGQCYFHLERYQESLNEVLKATKLEPYNADCFYWLGKIYLSSDDTERARKCFEKSVFLHPQHEQSVVLLSTIYRQLGEWELNAKILKMAAQAIPNTPCKWAESQLGFHYLAQNQFEDAIAAFRAVLRMDANSFFSWEGLADSYLKRGSFNSALKVYLKICELSKENVYARLQVANIQTTLNMFKEAIVSYEELLTSQPDYLPALKGIANAHMGIAQRYLEDHLIGRSKEHAERAVHYLINAIQIRNNFICLWRLLASSLDFIAALPASKAFLKIPGSLVNDNTTDFVTLQGDKIYELSSRFYCRAIKLSSNDTSLWYELALNYYNRAMRYGVADAKKKYLDLASESAKYIIKISPGDWKYWNLLGVICVTKEVNNLALAQHCFIKALQINKKVAVPWTNLGILYLLQCHGGDNEIAKIANSLFSQAQQFEPNYPQAWTGQAQVAESMDPIETIDLLRHSISLGYNDETAIRYAYWVCKLLDDDSIAKTDKRLRYYIDHLHAVSSGHDSITWYCNGKNSDASAEAYSILGYLNFVQGNWKTAVTAFDKAIEKSLEGGQRDKMLCNKAYCYLKSDEPQKAVQAFHDVAEATFRSTIGLAYSHFKAKQYEESYAVYENALELLANNDTEKSLILVALSSMVYAFQGDNEAKAVLFQCIGMKNPPIEALLSAYALGILHGDIQLSELVLKELNNHQRENAWCHHIAFLTSELYLKKGQKSKALLYLYSQVHVFPDKPLLRRVLANFLLRNCLKDEKHLTAANRMVQATITMLRTNSNATRQMTSVDVAKLLALASEAMRCINLASSQKLVQKAFHINPTCREARAAYQLLL